MLRFGTCFSGCILRIKDKKQTFTSWLKIEKQEEASDPAVGDDGIGDDLNKNSAVPSREQMAEVHDLMNVTPGVGCESSDVTVLK